MKKENIIYADLGNSRAKFLTEAGEFSAYSYDGLSPASVLKNHYREKLNLVYSSVLRSEDFPNILAHPRIRMTDAVEILKEIELIDFRGIEGIGSDRLFGLAGALSCDRSNAVTIDCGTAITINAMDKAGIVLGGTIMPGIEIQSKGLQTRTGKLTNIRVNPPSELLGINTDAAASSGVYLGIAGAIKSIVSKIATDTFKEKKVNIFLTGGSSSVILQYIDDELEVIHDEQLVLKGIKFTYKKWLMAKK